MVRVQLGGKFGALGEHRRTSPRIGQFRAKLGQTPGTPPLANLICATMCDRNWSAGGGGPRVLESQLFEVCRAETDTPPPMRKSPMEHVCVACSTGHFCISARRRLPHVRARDAAGRLGTIEQTDPDFANRCTGAVAPGQALCAKRAARYCITISRPRQPRSWAAHEDLVALRPEVAMATRPLWCAKVSTAQSVACKFDGEPRRKIEGGGSAKRTASQSSKLDDGRCHRHYLTRRSRDLRPRAGPVGLGPAGSERRRSTPPCQKVPVALRESDSGQHLAAPKFGANLGQAPSASGAACAQPSKEPTDPPVHIWPPRA